MQLYGLSNSTSQSLDIVLANVMLGDSNKWNTPPSHKNLSINSSYRVKSFQYKYNKVFSPFLNSVILIFFVRIKKITEIFFLFLNKMSLTIFYTD